MTFVERTEINLCHRVFRADVFHALLLMRELGPMSLPTFACFHHCHPFITIIQFYHYRPRHVMDDNEVFVTMNNSWQISYGPEYIRVP